MGPQTLVQWLASLRRKFGLRVRLRSSGVGCRGVRGLPPDERDRLLASTDAVFVYLRERTKRKERRKAAPVEQQQPTAPPMTPQPGRRVVGMVVAAGRPEHSRLLYEDEVREIDTRRCRVVGTIPWREQ
jgi:hypothetical protein